MNIREYQERMDDALGEVKRLLVQSGYYDNQTLENIDCDRDDPDDVQRWNEFTNASKLLVNYHHLKEVACSPAGLQFFPLDGLLGTVAVRATEYNGRSPLL